MSTYIYDLHNYAKVKFDVSSIKYMLLTRFKDRLVNETLNITFDENYVADLNEMKDDIQHDDENYNLISDTIDNIILCIDHFGEVEIVLLEM